MGASVEDERVFETMNTCVRYGLTGRVQVPPGATWEVTYCGRQLIRQAGESGAAKPSRDYAELPLARYLAHEVNIALLRAGLAESAVYALQGVNVGMVEIVAALQQARAHTGLDRLLAVEHHVLDQLYTTRPLAQKPVVAMPWAQPGTGLPTRATRFGIDAPLPRPGSLDDGGGLWRRDDGHPTQLLDDVCWWFRLTEGAPSGLLPIADRLDRAVEHLGVIANSRGGRRARLDGVAERLQVASLAVRGIHALRAEAGR